MESLCAGSRRLAIFWLSWALVANLPNLVIPIPAHAIALNSTSLATANLTPAQVYTEGGQVITAASVLSGPKPDVIEPPPTPPASHKHDSVPTVSGTVNSTTAAAASPPSNATTSTSSLSDVSNAKATATTLTGSSNNTVTSRSSSSSSTTTTTTTSSTTTTTTTTTPKPRKPTRTVSSEDDPSIIHVPSHKTPPSSSSLSPFHNNLDVEEPVAQLSMEHLGTDPQRRDLVIPVVAIIFAVPMLLGLFTVIVRRFKDYWLTRHYRRMDFLVDGMYND